jgi:hypothetical protein
MRIAGCVGMKTTLLTLAVALGLGALAGCDRAPEERSTSATSSSGVTSAPATPKADTPTTPANVGQPQSQAEKREGANPVQQQVDPKQAEQHRDFKMQGDAAGPKSRDTQPKGGG